MKAKKNTRKKIKTEKNTETSRRGKHGVGQKRDTRDGRERKR